MSEKRTATVHALVLLCFEFMLNEPKLTVYLYLLHHSSGELKLDGGFKLTLRIVLDDLGVHLKAFIRLHSVGYRLEL